MLITYFGELFFALFMGTFKWSYKVVYMYVVTLVVTLHPLNMKLFNKVEQTCGCAFGCSVTYRKLLKLNNYRQLFQIPLCLLQLI